MSETNASGLTAIPTSTIHDERLSLSALGLLLSLLAQDSIDSLDPAHLAELSADSPEEIEAALAELAECGYLVNDTLYDTPQTGER